MRMLQTWNGESNDLIYSFLKKFGIDSKKISLIKYEGLTPDSFIWFFSIEHKRYCLYAEDYIPSLKHVKQAMAANLPRWSSSDVFELIEVLEQEKWDESTPVKAATIYRPPDSIEEVMKYATTSGHDFVFLGVNKHKED